MREIPATASTGCARTSRMAAGDATTHLLPGTRGDRRPPAKSTPAKVGERPTPRDHRGRQRHASEKVGPLGAGPGPEGDQALDFGSQLLEFGGERASGA